MELEFNSKKRTSKGSVVWDELMWMRVIISVLDEMDERRWKKLRAASELILDGGSGDLLGASVLFPPSKTIASPASRFQSRQQNNAKERPVISEPPTQASDWPHSAPARSSFSASDIIYPFTCEFAWSHS